MLSKFQYKNIVAFIFVLAVFLELTDTFIVNVAFPSIAEQLHVSISSLSWVVNSYMLSIALVVPLSGYLGDRYGTKKMFLLAIAIFTTSSFLCAISNSFFTLILARSLQGIGAGMLVPVGQTMFFRAFPKNQLMKMMSIISVPILVAPALSQFIGGVIVEYLSWQWIFLVNIPIGLFCYFVSAKYLKESEKIKSTGFDYIGLLLSAFSFVFLFYALSKFEFNKPILFPLALLFSAIIVLLVFVRRILRTVNPFLNLRVYYNSNFRLSMISYTLLMSSCMGAFIVYNFYAQETLKISPIMTGFLSAPFCIGMLIITRTLDKICDIYGRKIPFITGVTLYIVATLAMLFIDNSNQYVYLCVLYFIRGMGQGFLSIILQTVAIERLPEKEIGHASAIICINWYLSVSLGVALFTLFISFLMNIYGINPVSFSSFDHRHDIVNIFRFVDILSAGLFFVALLVFLKIKLKKNNSVEQKNNENEETQEVF